MSTRVRLPMSVLVATLLWAGPWARCPAADWPRYRGTVARTACTAESLPAGLHAQWIYTPACAPRPAWPDPVREVNLMAFDHACHVAAAGGRVFFGSSADGRVRALALADGKPLWTRCTNAPVRFAPSVADGRVFVGSDDGCVYCLAPDSGRLLWRVRGGPRDERMLGNGQMMSRWPIRSGVLVDGGVVYFLAGMWPAEGVWAWSVHAANGKVLWKTPAPPKLAPQGCLSADDKTLFVLAGRADAWAIDRTTGQARPYKGRCQISLAGEYLFTGPFTHAANENLPVAGTAGLGPRRRMLVALDRKTGKPRGRLAGMEHLALDEKTAYVGGSGKLAAFALADLTKPRWQTQGTDVRSLAVAGDKLLAGTGTGLLLLDAATGKTLWSTSSPSAVLGLAVADGRVLASAADGSITCYGASRPPAPRRPAGKPASSPPASDAAKAQAAAILRRTGKSEGFCLVAGKGLTDTALALARQAKGLGVYVATPDESEAARARHVLGQDAACAGRVVVHALPAGGLPYPDYFADLVVTDARGTYAAAALGRVLRPCGGVAYVIGGAGRARQAVALPDGETLVVTGTCEGAATLTRGPLPGAGWWTHQYGTPAKSGSSGDRRVRWPLRMLWFGEPGPARMLNRHLRGTAPVCLDGGLYILGQHALMAVDAYNGRELWSRRLPFVGRRVVDIRGGSLATEGREVFLATADLCLNLDATTGRTRRRYRLPVRRPTMTLASPRAIDMAGGGQIELRRGKDALELVLTTVDAKVANADPAKRPTFGDSWELFFDARPIEERTETYAAGAFHVIVVPARPGAPKPVCTSGAWGKAPMPDVSGRADAKGTRTVVRLPWSQIEKLSGHRCEGLFFGAILNSSDNGKTRTARRFRFANDASYRLANCWGEIRLRAGASEDPKPKVLPAKAPERLTWGNLMVCGETVLGTTAETVDTPRVLALGRDASSEGHDYTGPVVPQVLANVGVEAGTRHVFALDRRTGRMRWHYTTKGVIPHNGVAVWRHQVYVLDRKKLPPFPGRGHNRRGKPTTAPVVDEDLKLAFIQVLDLATGRPVRRIEGDLAAAVGVRIGKGVLLATHMSGMTAFDAASGRTLWAIGSRQAMHHCSAYLRVPVIAGPWVYDEPHAYDLRTGTVRTGKAGKPWRWGGFRGCGTVSAGENVLFYRTGTPAVEDIAGLTGRYELPAFRPGCYINMIPAGGLALMPEASSGCGCPYNFQATVALQPAAGPAK